MTFGHSVLFPEVHLTSGTRRVMTSDYLTSVERFHEKKFAHSIGKPRFPSEYIGMYWTCTGKEDKIQ